MEKLLSVYKCLCDETRLRILNLLQVSPLCVCHIQHLLDISQVNASRHLSYLRRHGMVETSRFQNWTIYSLPARPSKALHLNLACLQDLCETEKIFVQDRRHLMKLLQSKDVRSLLKEGGCSLPSPQNLTGKSV
ncbi:MAG: ArsR/SmtB family transcription factor [Kiritimatiellia bacterium]